MFVAFNMATPEPKVIKSCSISERIVKKLLVNCETVALSAKLQSVQKTGEIYLISIATTTSEVYIFDIHSCPDLLHEGALWRILKSPALLKILHDCRALSFTLKKRYGIQLNNVFDTQAAYGMFLMEINMPARLIQLHYLYEKYGDAHQRLMPILQESVETGGIFWAQRPMSKWMVYMLACETLALTGTMYENIKREICDEYMDLFQDLCYAYTTGEFKRATNNLGELNTHGSNKGRLNASEKRLVANSIPRSAAESHKDI